MLFNSSFLDTYKSNMLQVVYSLALFLLDVVPAASLDAC